MISCLSPIGTFEKNEFNLNYKIKKEFKFYIKCAKSKEFHPLQMENYLNKNINVNKIIREMYSKPYKYNIKICSNVNIQKCKLNIVFANTNIALSSQINNNNEKIDPIKIEYIKNFSTNEIISQFYFNALSSKFYKSKNGNIFQICIYMDNIKIFSSCAFKIFSRKNRKNCKQQQQQQKKVGEIHHHHYYYHHYYK